jgi:hypothetical protein
MLGKNAGNLAWNKGKTKDSDFRVAAIGAKVSRSLSGRTYEDIYGRETGNARRRQHQEVLLGRKRIYRPDGTWTLGPKLGNYILRK